GTTTASGAANANAFQYTGRENDGTGLYYYRARYYHPGLQRFISEDPIGFGGGINIYAYVGGNPVNRIDPDGQYWWVAVPVIVIPIIHWTRNYWNESISFQDAQKYWQEMSPAESLFHRMGPGNEGNRKFISPSGHSEAVFTPCGAPVTDPLNEASYNFADPY